MGQGSRKRPQPKLLAKKLKTIREECGWTQQQMAGQLRKTPSAPDGAMISRFERGEREPNLLVIAAYCEVARISTDVLIDDKWSVKDLAWAMRQTR
ncbi:MAG TPA: helix-turn-helix transcriptional regulator [Pyrinomonadaceae bacterium]|nr:helix-turn-helix transcriptional regulator [Pyrinomonadaceae bacterium]